MSNKEKPPDAGLHAAVACYKPELIDSLLAEGADVNAVSRNGHTPLLSAATRFFEKKAPSGAWNYSSRPGRCYWLNKLLNFILLLVVLRFLWLLLS